MSHRARWRILSCLALCACPDRVSPRAVDAGVVPDRPVALVLGVRVLFDDGGVSDVVVEQGSPTVVDPAVGLDVTTNVPLADYRVRLFDEADKALASDDSAEERADHVRYSIRLKTPLKRGHRYTLGVDSQSGGPVTMPDGGAQPDLRLELVVAGARESDPSTPLKRKRR